MENIKKAVKESIIQNFMEAAKFAPRGAEKQRPKSWSKGTKSGSDKRKMREQGKRESDPRGVYEEAGYQYNPQPDDPRPGQPGGPPDPEAERKEMGERISNAVHDWVEETGLHKQHGHSTDEMRKTLKGRIKNVYNTNYGNVKDDVADAASDLISVYPAPKGVDQKEYRKHMEQGIHGYATGGSLENRDKMLTGNPYYDAINESFNRSSYYYNRLKENNEIPRYARETPEETPDYYGQLERERAQGLSNEEPNSVAHTPESVSKLLQQAHETALSRAMTAFGKGGKHAKRDPFHMIGHYADELTALHTNVMGDASS